MSVCLTVLLYFSKYFSVFIRLYPLVSISACLFVSSSLCHCISLSTCIHFSLSVACISASSEIYDLRDKNRRHEGGGLTVTEVSNLSQTTVSWCDHILPYVASLNALVRVPPDRFEQVWSSLVGAL